MSRNAWYLSSGILLMVSILIVFPLCAETIETVKGKIYENVTKYKKHKTFITFISADGVSNLFPLSNVTTVKDSEGKVIFDGKNELCQRCRGRKKLPYPRCRKEHTTIPCKICKGSGRSHPCHVCRKRGKIWCKKCHGIGRALTIKKSPLPGGGTRIDHSYGTCGVCKGNKYVPCEMCSNTGFLRCKSCKGKGGTIGVAPGSCLFCGGTSVIPCLSCNRPVANIFEVNEKSLRKSLGKRAASADPIEGIWMDALHHQYRIAVVPDTAQLTRDFVGVILVANSAYWFPNQIKAEFTKTASVGIYTGKYYSKSHKCYGVTFKLGADGILTAELPDDADEGARPPGKLPSSPQPRTISFVRNFPLQPLSQKAPGTILVAPKDQRSEIPSLHLTRFDSDDYKPVTMKKLMLLRSELVDVKIKLSIVYPGVAQDINDDVVMYSGEVSTGSHFQLEQDASEGDSDQPENIIIIINTNKHNKQNLDILIKANKGDRVDLYGQLRKCGGSRAPTYFVCVKRIELQSSPD